MIQRVITQFCRKFSPTEGAAPGTRGCPGAGRSDQRRFAARSSSAISSGSGAGPARAEGISIRTLAAAIGVSPSRVHQLVADAGLDVLDAALGELRAARPAPEDPDGDGTDLDGRDHLADRRGQHRPGLGLTPASQPAPHTRPRPKIPGLPLPAAFDILGFTHKVTPKAYNESLQ